MKVRGLSPPADGLAELGIEAQSEPGNRASDSYESRGAFWQEGLLGVAGNYFRRYHVETSRDGEGVRAATRNGDAMALALHS